MNNFMALKHIAKLLSRGVEPIYIAVTKSFIFVDGQLGLGMQPFTTEEEEEACVCLQNSLVHMCIDLSTNDTLHYTC